MKTGPDYLAQFANTLKTTMGACFPGDKVIFRGQTLHQDLQDISWFDLYLFGITGRRFEKNQLQLLQTIWTYTSYPDARIWNNRVAALTGNTKSTGNLAVSAALAVSEADIYGAGVLFKAITFLTNSNFSLKKGGDLKALIKQEIHKHGVISGYSRPLSSDDERLTPTLDIAHSLDLGDGPHIKIAFKIEEILLKKASHLKINYGGIAAALAADVGLSPKEFYHFTFPMFLAGMFPCYIEAASNPSGTLFPTACHNIHYTGKPERQWPPT